MSYTRTREREMLLSERSLKIGYSLLMAVLLGALATQTTFAQDATSHAPPVSQISQPNSAARNIVGPATAAVAAVNGTGLTRPGVGSGIIRGSAKTVAGTISGTSYRPKH